MNSFASWFAILLLIGLPVVLLHWRGAAWKWFGLGILSWALAVVVKTLITYSLHALFLDNWPLEVRSVIDGAISALTELGAAVWFLRKAQLRLIDVLAFGIGIGVFEVVFTLALGYLESWDDGIAPGNRFDFIDSFFLMERVLALSGHTASRLLIYTAVQRKWLMPALVSFALFSLTDGLASYGLGAKWDWNAQVMSRFLGVVAVIVLGEVFAAIWFLRKAKLLDDSRDVTNG